MNVVKKYEDLDARDEIVYMPLEDAIGLSEGLAQKVADAGASFDLIVGLANGALLTTQVVADWLQVAKEIVRVRRKSSRLKQRLLIAKRLLRLPPAVLRWKPLNELNKAFNRRGAGIEQERYAFEVAGKRILLVDDCMDSGRSVKSVRERLLGEGAAEVKIAVLGWGKKEWAILPDQVPPDFYLHRLLHFYPWANNSPDYRRFVAWIEGKGLHLWK